MSSLGTDYVVLCWRYDTAMGGADNHSGGARRNSCRRRRRPPRFKSQKAMDDNTPRKSRSPRRQSGTPSPDPRRPLHPKEPEPRGEERYPKTSLPLLSRSRCRVYSGYSSNTRCSTTLCPINISSLRPAFILFLLLLHSAIASDHGAGERDLAALSLLCHLVLLCYFVYVQCYDASVEKGSFFDSATEGPGGRWKFITHINLVTSELAIYFCLWASFLCNGLAELF